MSATVKRPGLADFQNDYKKLQKNVNKQINLLNENVI